MQLTLQTDYSIRVLIYLAFLEEDKTVTIDEIVKQYEISRGHVMKVVYNLSKKGYIKSIRGKGGGVKLARPAAEINIGKVIKDIEPNFHVVECMDAESDGCNIKRDCTLIPILFEATNQFLGVFEKYTLQDVIKDKSNWSTITIVNKKP